MKSPLESVARAFVRAINRQDLEALATLMTEEHRFLDAIGNIVEGRDKMRTAWSKYFQMIPDYSVHIDEVFCDGPVVVLLGRAQGTYSPDGQLKPENRWTMPAAFRALIAGGRVAEWRVYCDNEPLRQRMSKSA